MAHDHQPNPHHRRRTSRWVAAVVGTLAFAVATAQADDERRRRKPAQPSFQIDNEGPATVLRHARSASDHHRRFADPDQEFWFPARSIIRLDLILPIRTRPLWVSQGRPGPWRPWVHRP